MVDVPEGEAETSALEVSHIDIRKSADVLSCGQVVGKITSDEGLTNQISRTASTASNSSTIRAEKYGDATRTEVWAWYMYDFANSPYFQVMTVLTPFLLTMVARGYANGESAMPGLGVAPKSFTSIVKFAMIVLQLICILTFSAFGDFGSRRKQLLRILTWVGAGFLMLNIFTLSYSMWWLPALLRIFSGVCFIMCTVYYNSYMPMLTSAHYSLKDAAGVRLPAGDERNKKESQLLDEMSNKGQSCGYVGGMSMQVFCILFLWLAECDPHETECSEWQRLWPPCLCISVVGVWWIIFSLYTFKHLKPRPGPAFPEGNVLLIGWKEVRSTISLMCKYRDMGLYTISFFISSDAFNTTLDLIIFISADDEKAVPSSSLLLGIQGAILGLLGTVLFYWLQSCTGVSAKTMLLSQLCTYFVLAAIMAVWGAPLFSKETPFWQYACIMLPVALMIGSLQAFQRALFSSLTPVGKESAFFAFYAMVDKGSALVGNGVTAICVSATGEYAGVFWYCVGMYTCSIVILFFVNVENGTHQANNHD